MPFRSHLQFDCSIDSERMKNPLRLQLHVTRMGWGENQSGIAITKTRMMEKKLVSNARKSASDDFIIPSAIQLTQVVRQRMRSLRRCAKMVNL